MTSYSRTPGRAKRFTPLFGDGPVGTATRSLLVLAMAVVTLMLGARPAWADPARPTNYLSEVTEIDPLPSGVSVDITGGDSFLQISVALGHTVLVPGYFNEPYIRVDADNSVWVNQNSPAFYINQDRYGNVSVPDGITGDSQPEWVKVGAMGRYAWHDHRVHWMSYDLPPTVAGDVEQQVFPWEIPILIDGVDTTVRGDLLWLPSHSPLGPLLAGLVALLPLAAWGTRSPTAKTVMIAAGASVAGYLTIVQNNGTPAAARGFPFTVLFPAIAVMAGGVAAGFGKSRPEMANWATFVAGLSLFTWSLLGMKVLWMPVLVSRTPILIQRSSTGFVLWASLGVLVVAAAAVLSSAARHPRLLAGKTPS